MVKELTSAHVILCFHTLPTNTASYKEEFLQYVNYYKNQNSISLYTFTENKNILIINNLAPLMKQQFDSGNVHKINSMLLPNTIKSIQYIENGYTFLNRGPHQSILETAHEICDKVGQMDFDGAIVSAGAYGFLIANYIISELRKDVFVIGGELPHYFGIVTKRCRLNDEQKSEYYVSVPPEMRPPNYEKIENGCYW